MVRYNAHGGGGSDQYWGAPSRGFTGAQANQFKGLTDLKGGGGPSMGQSLQGQGSQPGGLYRNRYEPSSPPHAQQFAQNIMHQLTEGQSSTPFGSTVQGVNNIGRFTQALQNLVHQNPQADGTDHGAAFGGAPDLYKQYQGLASGWSPEREALIKQMQGTDNGAQFNTNMKSAGYQLGGGMGGNFNYKPVAGPVAQPAGGSAPDWRSKMY